MVRLKAPGKPGRVMEAAPKIATGRGFGVSAESILLSWASVRFVVADGWESISEGHEIEWMVEGVPAYRLKNGPLTTMVCSDPDRDAVVMKVRYEGDGRLFALVIPHKKCEACIDHAMFFARADVEELAVGCSAPFRKMSVGYSGVSDALTDIRRHKEITEVYTEPAVGNVVLAGEIDLRGCDGQFTYVVGGSRHEVSASLNAGFVFVYDDYVRRFREQQARFLPLGESDPALRTMYRISTAALLCAEEGSAALAWGFLAAGDVESAVRIFLDLEEAPADVILLADIFRREGHLPETLDLGPMVRRAAKELIATGMWNSKALLVAADFFTGQQAEFLRELASSSLGTMEEAERRETTTGPTWEGRPDLVAELGPLGEAQRLLDTMVLQAGPAGFLPERIWDEEDLPARGLFNGLPVPGPMPFIPAHVAFIRLLRSSEVGKRWGEPEAAKGSERYVVWRFRNQVTRIKEGEAFRIQTRSPALVRWSFDKWDRYVENQTTDSGFGIHYLDLPTQTLKPGSRVVFTFYWTEVEAWEGVDNFLDIFS